MPGCGLETTERSEVLHQFLQAQLMMNAGESKKALNAVREVLTYTEGSVPDIARMAAYLELMHNSSKRGSARALKDLERIAIGERTLEDRMFRAGLHYNLGQSDLSLAEYESIIGSAGISGESLLLYCGTAISANQFDRAIEFLNGSRDRR